MYNAKGCITEIYLDGPRCARISCPPALLPAPGQYLLATSSSDPDSALAQPIFSAGICPAGFYSATPLPGNWLPGAQLDLRGPFGRGFNLPASARRVALTCFGVHCGRVLALLEAALAHGAALVLLSDVPPAGLPARVEISPLATLPETALWADYLAIDIPREQIQTSLGPIHKQINFGYTQILVSTSVPCGGMAACGVCSVRTRAGVQLACKDGPVFDLEKLDFRV